MLRNLKALIGILPRNICESKCPFQGHFLYGTVGIFLEQGFLIYLSLFQQLHDRRGKTIHRCIPLSVYPKVVKQCIQLWPETVQNHTVQQITMYQMHFPNAFSKCDGEKKDGFQYRIIVNSKISSSTTFSVLRILSDTSTINTGFIVMQKINILVLAPKLLQIFKIKTKDSKTFKAPNRILYNQIISPLRRRTLKADGTLVLTHQHDYKDFNWSRVEVTW